MGTVMAHGTVDLLAIRYTLGGAFGWAQVIGGTRFDNVGGVALTPEGARHRAPRPFVPPA